MIKFNSTPRPSSLNKLAQVADLSQRLDNLEGVDLNPEKDKVEFSQSVEKKGPA